VQEKNKITSGPASIDYELCDFVCLIKKQDSF